jgi:midasin (ATPase involved in ribosome maturation)
MINERDLVSIIVGAEGSKARAILKANGTDFSIYSCNPQIVSRILNDADKTDVLSLIKESNEKEKDIDEIIFSRKYNKSENDLLKSFFDAFDNEKTRERLFLLIGETGVGKTYMIEKRYPKISTYACRSDLDPYSLCYYLADTDGTGLKPHETPFLKAIKGNLEDNRVVLDEFNELPHDTLMFIQGLTDEKKSIVVGDKVIEISPKFKILATMNPPSETDERNPLGDALLGRAVGFVLELTDDTIISRLKITKKWLSKVRELYSFIRASGLIDCRELDYRDYAKMSRYDFSTILKFKVCQGDIRNIREYSKISSTGEYQQLVREIINEQSNFVKG